MELNQRLEEGNKDQRTEDGGGDVASSASGAAVARRLSRFEITPVTQGGKVQNTEACWERESQLVDLKGDVGGSKRGSSDANSMERKKKQTEQQSHFVGFPMKSILKSPANAFGYPSSNPASTVTYGL